MNTPLPVKQIAGILAEVGYSPLEVPLEIASLAFHTPAALVGRGELSDLILIEDTLSETPEKIQQRILSIARALDIVGSRRPLTTILVGPRPSARILTALSRVCRALPIDSTDNDEITNRLAVLLPLSLSGGDERVQNPLSELETKISLQYQDPSISNLFSVAAYGVSHVEQHLKDMLAEPFNSHIGD